MEDLWGILGYDDVASDIVEVLGTDGVGLIQGPPGVGKSWLAKDIGTLWDSGGGATLLAEGDLQRSDVPFHPFGFAMAPLPSSWKNVRPAIAGVARAGETLVGTAGLITSTIEAVAKLRENRRRERRRFLGDAEQKILCDLEKAGKKRPLLLIADNLHWWDSKSLAFLGSLRSESMIRAFPFLASLRILGVEASQPHQRVVDPEAHSAFLAQLSTPPYELGRIKRESLSRPVEKCTTLAG